MALDTTSLQRTSAGTATMVRGLIDGMVSLREDVHLHPLAPPFPWVRNWGVLARKMDTLLKDLVWVRALLPTKLAEGGYDLYHAPYLNIPESIPLPWVANVLDLYMRRNPRAFTPWAVRQYLRRESRLRQASGVLCISKFTREELLTFQPELDPQRVRVAHLAPRPVFAPRSADRVREARRTFGLEDRPFVLWVGTVEPRKRIVPLLEAVSAAGTGDLQWVLVGSDGWIPKYVNRFHRLVEGTPAFRRTGRISDEDLAALYSGAEALVFPSVYEGFGLPVIEAMATGCPVIASQGSSLDEVCGGHALQLDPERTEDWVEALRALPHDSETRAGIAERGKRSAAAFTWLRFAQQTLEVYRNSLEK